MIRPFPSFRSAQFAAVAIFIALVRLPLIATAALVVVPNYSFEADPVSDVNARAGATGWVGSTAFFTQNSGNESFPGTAGSGTPTGADGPQHAILADFHEDLNFFRSAASLGTWAAGSTYRLTIAIGNLVATNSFPGTLRIGFLVGDGFVPGGDTTFQAATFAPNGAFRDFSFEYTAHAEDTGKSMKIYVAQLGHGTGSTGLDVAVDNVRLETVPEPSAALLLLGGTAICGFTRRRHCLPQAA